MNDTIKECWLTAAREDCSDKWDSQVEFIERFAKLIVKECLNNMENCDGDLDFAIWKTKEDFGVKE